MAGELVLVHVDSADLYKTGHMAHRWFGKVSRRLSTFTKASAPKRSGALRQGIHTNMRSIPQARRMAIDWRSEAPYSIYVLRGTTGPIMTNLGWEMTGGADFPNGGLGYSWTLVPGPIHGGMMRRNLPGVWMPVGGEVGNPHPRRYRTKVNGQKANNYLLKGWRKTSHFHRSMRAIPPSVRNP